VVFGIGEITSVNNTKLAHFTLKKVDIDCQLKLVATILMPDRAIFAPHSVSDGTLQAEHLHIAQENWKEGAE
jgi:hypothetical protein